MMKSNEPEIMGTTKNILSRFFNFLGKNLYFVLALFFINFLYIFLINKFVISPKINYFVNLIFNISFYPVIMIFTMYMVNLFYAGKKGANLQDIFDEGKRYFQPLIFFYICTIFLRAMIPPKLAIFMIMLFVKLAFVEQLIYYRSYTVVDAVKASWKMVGIRLFIVLFVGAFISMSMLHSIGQYLYSSGNFGAYLSVAVKIFAFVLLKFLLTVFYRELIKIDFYSSKI